MVFAHEINIEAQSHFIYHLAESGILFLLALGAFFLLRTLRNHGK